MRKISVFALAALFAACQSQSDNGAIFGAYATADCLAVDDEFEIESMPMASAKAAPMMRNSMATGGQMEDAVEQSVTERKLIKNGSMTLVVDNLEQTRNDVVSLIEKHKGYVSNEQYSNWEHTSS